MIRSKTLLHIGRIKQASSFRYTVCLCVCVCKCACVGKSEGILLPLSNNEHCFAIPLSLNEHCFAKKELKIIESFFFANQLGFVSSQVIASYGMKYSKIFIIASLKVDTCLLMSR